MKYIMMILADLGALHEKVGLYGDRMDDQKGGDLPSCTDKKTRELSIEPKSLSRGILRVVVER